jgi:hypothetical protein
VAYDLYAVHANRGLAAFQKKQGKNCPTFLWNRGAAIQFDGTDSVWAISPSTVKLKDDLSTGGFQQKFSLRFSALAAQFYTRPGPNTPELLRAQMSETPIGYLGASYKIETVEIAPNGLVLTIEANAFNENA